jgi:hypothetical protein
MVKVQVVPDAKVVNGVAPTVTLVGSDNGAGTAGVAVSGAVSSVKLIGNLPFDAKNTWDADVAASRVAEQADFEPLLTRLLMPTTATADRIPIKTIAMSISMSVNPESDG